MPGTSILYRVLTPVIYHITGTIIGAFIVDYLGPKYTMVRLLVILGFHQQTFLVDPWSRVASHRRIFYEWLLCPVSHGRFF